MDANRINPAVLCTVILHDSLAMPVPWHSPAHELTRQYMHDCIHNLIMNQRLSVHSTVWYEKLRVIVQFIEKRLYFTASSIAE